MARCKFCDRVFQWGRVEEPGIGGRWVPFVPVGEDDGLDRAFQDEHGNLRADHRIICVNRGGAAVRAVRLAKVIPASSIVPGAWSEPDEDGVIAKTQGTILEHPDLVTHGGSDGGPL